MTPITNSALHPAVTYQFRAFNEPFEGAIPYMYLDILGLVTTGVGNLIDPVALAAALPFRFKHKPGIATPGALATPAQIMSEWQKLKSKTCLAQDGHHACEPLTDLMLDDDAIDDLIAKRLAEDEKCLQKQAAFKNLATWPADAQLALLSMAWAVGPSAFSGFHRFSQACEKGDFQTAAAECKINEAGNPGVIPRNRSNALLFRNAARVRSQASSRQIETLYYPEDLSASR